MFKGVFWKTVPSLWRFRGLFPVIGAGALLTILSFGAGLGMLVPVFKLLVSDQKRLDTELRAFADEDRLNFLDEPARWVADVLPSDPFQQFIVVLIVMGVLTALGSYGRYLHTASVISLSFFAARGWRTKVYRRVIRLPLQEMQRRGASDVIIRTLGDVTTMANGYRVIFDRAIESLLKGMVALLVAFVINWQLSAMAMIATPVVGLIVRKFGKYIRRSTKREMRHRGRLMQKLTEGLHNMAVVKVHNAEGVERRRLHTVQREMLREQLIVRKIKAMSSPLMETIAAIVLMGIVAIAAYQVLRLDVPVAQLFAVVTSLALAGQSIKPLSALNNELQIANAAAERVLELLDEDLAVEPTGIERGERLPPAPSLSRSVRFEAVRFRYVNAEDEALRGLTLEIPAGASVAVVGANGSGKSTLLNLLPRLLTPTAGRVLIDEVDIAGVDLKDLRSKIALVTQKTVLFGGSIASNIAYGRAHTPRAAIEDAARRAFADEFVRALPRGYDTSLSEGGVGLSGGQGQRIAIARAILRDPPILILDEATSQVDADSEMKIKLALDEAARGRTTFWIAHRFSTVVDADLIVVMEQGRVVATGKHAELVESSDHYRTLLASQLAGDTGLAPR